MGDEQGLEMLDSGGQSVTFTRAEVQQMLQAQARDPIGLAFQFIALCNQSQRLVGIVTPTGVEWREQELPPAQDAVFRRACVLLGRYFMANGGGGNYGDGFDCRACCRRDGPGQVAQDAGRAHRPPDVSTAA